MLDGCAQLTCRIIGRPARLRAVPAAPASLGCAVTAPARLDATPQEPARLIARSLPSSAHLRASVVCVINLTRYLRVTPEVIWVNTGTLTADFHIDCNTNWEIH